MKNIVRFFAVMLLIIIILFGTGANTYAAVLNEIKENKTETTINNNISTDQHKNEIDDFENSIDENITNNTVTDKEQNEENNNLVENNTQENEENVTNNNNTTIDNNTSDKNNVINNEITDNTVVEEEPKEEQNEVTKNNTAVNDSTTETTEATKEPEETTKEEVQNKTIETKEVKTGRTHQDGIYKIAIGKDSSKTIEVKGSNTKNNAEVDIWNYGNVPAQKFYLEYQEEGYYKITAMHTGKALTVKDGALEENSEIVQSDYEGLDSQKWVLRDTNVAGWVISLLSNPELSITVEGNIENGSKLVLGKTENNENQMFWIYNITTSEQYKANGTYKLAIGIDSNKALEIAGSSTENNAKVDLWKYGNKSSQKFKLEYINGYYKIAVIHTRKALTVKDGVLEEGREIVQADYAELDSQKWILRDTNVAGWVISPLSNPQLSITVEGNIVNGSRIILSKTKDNNNQMFWLSNVSTEPIIKENGIYKIAMNKDSSKTVEVRGSNRENNAEVDIWNYGNVAAQKFYLTYEEGYYKITVMHTGKALTVKDGNLVEGAQIVQYDYQGLDSQKWILRDSSINGWVMSLQSNPELSITVEGNVVNGSRLILGKTEDNDNQMMLLYNITVDEKVKENGIYKIAIGKDPSKTVEVKGSNRENNAEVDIWNYGNVPAQKFYLSYEEGYYKITAMHTGKALTVKDGNLVEGVQIVQYDYQGLDSQKWILRDTNINGWIISPIYNLNLSITVQGNIENGGKLVLSKTEDNEKQKLYLYNITEEERTHSDRIYKIAVGADSSKTIEVKGSNKENNAEIDIWNYGNVDAQRFNFEYIDGFYKITAMHTGKALTVKNGSLQEGSEIVQYDYEGLDSQKWILRDTGINGWVISLLSNPDLSITIQGNIENGAKLILSKTEDNDNQMFYIQITQIVIVINPGHGGSEIGCANGNLAEKNVTLNIAQKIQNNLSRYSNIKVILTRTGDYYMDLPSRAMIARNNNADLYVSLHINDEASHVATGSQVYVPFYEGTRHYNSSMTSLANLIQDKLGNIGISENISGGTVKRNIDQLPKYQYLMNGQVVQADYYADIRHAMKGDTMEYGPDLNTNTGIPTVLVEHCFMNSSDSRFLDSEYDLQRIADADCEAILEYFGL